MDDKTIKHISDDSWFVWSKHVLMQLENDSKCLHEIKKELTDIKVELGRLKERSNKLSAIYGLIGGAIPVAIMLGVKWIANQP